MGTALRIEGRDDSGAIGFDLREILVAVGTQSHLRWFANIDNWVAASAQKAEAGPAESVARARTRLEASRPGRRSELTWNELEELPTAAEQFVQAEFIGYLRSKPELAITVVDSASWFVWANDEAVLARIRAAFPNAKDAPDELEPELLRR